MSNPGKRKVAVVGAGPGGLTAALLLAYRGFDVTVFEKADSVGGRNGEIALGPYRFDIGPTFLMMKFLLDEIFEETGRDSAKCMEFVDLDPMYELSFKGTTVKVSSDRTKMAAEMERAFPGSSARLGVFLERERTRFLKMYPCLQKDYSTLWSMTAPVLLKALPHLSLGSSMYDILARYFEQDDLRISFTFQSKYLGMSPWSCPAAFMIIPFIEHAFGIQHVQGGLSEISRAMTNAIAEEGGAIRLGSPVKKVIVEKRRARGVELESGERFEADAVVINADFGHAMSTLFEPGIIRKWSPEKLRKKPYSCSTFMLYLGLDKIYPCAHHAIHFSDDYERFIADVADRKVMSDDISLYVRNSSVTDPQVAPEGHSAVYVLVPTPNNTSGIDWKERSESFAELVLDRIEQRTAMSDIRAHIVERKVITPEDWEARYDVFIGGTFNLAHTLNQMLYYRPRNRFEEVADCYLTGGGTHPGSGLPTIYESGRISANLICRRFGMPVPPFKPPPMHLART